MNGDVEIVIGGVELLDRVGPMWEELKQHHAKLAPRWADTLAGDFDERRKELIGKGGGGLCVVLASVAGKDVGYSVSTIVAGDEGEIDSFYVAKEHRQRGIGGKIMERTMQWFSEQAVRGISVDVIEGNDDARKFYQRSGFGVRTLRMRYRGG